MTEEQIFEKVREIAADQLEVDQDDIKLTSNIKDDLDADSLDFFEIMNELEDAFDIKLESDEDVATIDDVVKYVKKQLDNKQEIQMTLQWGILFSGQGAQKRDGP